MQISVRVPEGAPFLDLVDPVFGWTGISYRFPFSWRWTAGEVYEKLEQVSETAIKHAEEWQKRHPERFMSL